MSAMTKAEKEMRHVYVDSMSSMTNAEKEMLYSYIDLSINYLEFGSGESTIYASSVPKIKTITSVESSEQYINENLKHNTAIASALSTGKLSFHCVDIGETIAYGEPKDMSKRHLWPNYSLSVFYQKSEHDLVLVDGRFRIACTLNCVLNSPSNCTILIHDFWNRPEYHVVLKFLKIVDRVDTLGVFKKGDRVNICQIQSLIETYQYLPRDKTISYKIKEKLTKHFSGRS
jgi:hypothetical protein